TEGATLARQSDTLLDHHPSIHVDASRRNVVDNARAARGQANEPAVRRHDGLRNLERARQAGVFCLVTRLAMHWYRDLRSGPTVHLREFVAAGMSWNRAEWISGRQKPAARG